MAGRWNLLLLALYLSLVTVLSIDCPEGFGVRKGKCNDVDECDGYEDGEIGPCGENTVCRNTIGSFYCQCVDGYLSTTQTVNFTAGTPATCIDFDECAGYEDGKIGPCGENAVCHNSIGSFYCQCVDGYMSTTQTGNTKMAFQNGDNVTCIDIDECQEENVCGQNAKCINTLGSYYCLCNNGFGLKSGKLNFTGRQEQCEDICMIDKTICGNGTCHRGASGHYCACHAGFTNYGNKEYRCTELICDTFKEMDDVKLQTFQSARDLLIQLKNSCLELTESENSTLNLDGNNLLERLLSAIDELLFSGALNDNKKVSTFLDIVENALRLIGPFIKPPRKTKLSAYTDLELLVHNLPFPKGAVSLSSSSNQTRVGMQWETVAGDPSRYPGFAAVSLLSYANLNDSANGFFQGVKREKGIKGFKINSKIITVTVSNTNTSHLEEPVQITFYHLNQADKNNHTCVFWDSSLDEGSWSDKGCYVKESNLEYTVCSCHHLSSFAVLMAVYDIETKFELQLITWVGLSLSLVCLFICILTFSLIRSIQSPRTTIHLHLCITLFIANLIFLAGISQTQNKVGCAVVAGLLHFFYLAAFCWMCLEGIQLFRMVVLVFNTNFKTLYMMAGGYGVPAVIVAISALSNAKGYGTEKHCWLDLKLIWTFFGPVCVIIVVNIVFFLITVWKLAQKFSSLNPDLQSLQKIKAFIITAVAQLCVLGIMWIFGCFQFEEGTIVMSYLFTIFGSLQGVLLFVMHCLFSKQVRDEYGSILSRLCTPQKKRYSEFSHSSKAPASKSSQDTGESHI
ncbi:adhesion G protein-coupled receptor E1-like isoform X1 [Scomber scombrus]|uniref:adhesion G protein-coupled receptor E1-like isoform X1 n=1 Tax=Scomber scombrus TaxID=13677 RepID=UPI002DDAA057|nr:adhesion G protein-coupled receptor E1-like isoform X1 [Scomber scombrus]